MSARAKFGRACTKAGGRYCELTPDEAGTVVAGKIVTEAATLTPVLGFFEFIDLLKRLKVAPYVILKARLRLNRKKEKRS